MPLNHKRPGFPPVLSLASIVLGGALISACTTNSQVATVTTSEADRIAGNTETNGPMFKPPVRLAAEGADIQTPVPGYASPAWYDVTGDGRADLVVGQFKDGLMGVYSQNRDGSFAARQWLQAEGVDAKVPGVW